MRIEKLNENTKKNLLDDLLKRSPNNYGKFEASVQEILNAVKEKGDEAVFDYTEKFDGMYCFIVSLFMVTPCAD